MKDKIAFLIDLEQRGLEALNQDRFQEAAKLFEQITEIFPEFEHGGAFYNLACALEEIEEIERARKAYEMALFYEPDDYIKIGGYASFLYLHGNPQEAFEAYLNLLKIYNDMNIDGITSCYQALYHLGKKMGWTRDKVKEAITTFLKEKKEIYFKFLESN